MTQSMMNSCPVCGKRHVVMWPDMYVYRRGPTYYCSEDCMIVAATKDQKMIHMIAHMRAKKGSKKEMKLTKEQTQQCIDMALHGESPLKYIEGCGINNPACTWWNIKKNLQKNDPETYEKLPAKFRGVQASKKAPETPEQVPVVKLSGPIKIETPEANKVEVVETPEMEKEKENEFGLPAYISGFEIIGIRGQFGTYRASSEYNYFEFVPFGGELCMNPGDWREQLEELQKDAKVLGVKL